MQNKYKEIQNQYCSSYDRRKLCAFDIEYIDRPTKPLIHQIARFLYIISGDAYIDINGKEYHLLAGSLVAITSWQTTCITKVNKAIQFYKLVFNGDFILSAMKESYNPSHEIVKVFKPIYNSPCINLTSEEKVIVLDIFNTIKSEVGIDSVLDKTEEKELSNLYITNKLIELLIQYKRFISKKDCETSDGNIIELDNRPRIFKYIYSHLADRLTLNSIANVFYMSESALSKYIIQVTGLNYQDFVNEMRNNKVCDLLSHTDLSLNDIAYIVGYSDSSHLIKVFTDKLGISPKEYRKIYASKDQIFKERDRSVSFEMIDWIHKHYMEDIKVTDCAKRFNLTVVDVNLVLLYHIEQNYEEFLNYLRINRACELLLTTDLPIVNIGLEVGYNTLKTFSRNFLKLKGITPNNFRKNITLQLDSETIPDDIY